VNVAELEEILALLDPDTVVTDQGSHIVFAYRTTPDTVTVPPTVGCFACGQDRPHQHAGETREYPARVYFSGTRQGPPAYGPAPDVTLHGARWPRKPKRGPRLDRRDVTTIRRLYERTHAELPPGLDYDIVDLLERLDIWAKS
jgi:hypothetical protein